MIKIRFFDAIELIILIMEKAKRGENRWSLVRNGKIEKSLNKLIWLLIHHSEPLFLIKYAPNILDILLKVFSCC